MSPLTRRTLLRSGAAGAGLMLAGDLGGLFETAEADDGYGPLIDDPAGLLALPAGFSYSVVAHAGSTRLDTGQRTPSDPDGMAAFERPAGGTVLICNHELTGREAHHVPRVEGFTYDPVAAGGTTTIEVNAKGRRVGQVVSLAGTVNNCAGGRSPWDTWLTCEESERMPGQSKPHGFVFEVDPFDQEANRDPQPIRALGRFAHESLVVDPRGGRIYMTEDNVGPNGLLYRWIPPPSAVPLGPGSLRDLGPRAGRLQALRATTRKGVHVADLSVATRVGTTYRAAWIQVPDRLAARTSIRKQFADRQITRGRKLEGMWWGRNGFFFVSSFARVGDGSRRSHDGQVWFYDPRERTIQLKLRFAPTSTQLEAAGPDNVTVSPYGGLILAEDGLRSCHLVGATAKGRTYLIARSDDPVHAEFAGPVFSPDRSILFANLQTPGYVFAIKGPWRRM